MIVLLVDLVTIMSVLFACFVMLSMSKIIRENLTKLTVSIANSCVFTVISALLLIATLYWFLFILFFVGFIIDVVRYALQNKSERAFKLIVLNMFFERIFSILTLRKVKTF